MSSGSKKGTQICYSFPFKESWQANLLQVPQRGHYGEKYPLTGCDRHNQYLSSEATMGQNPEYGNMKSYCGENLKYYISSIA